MSRPRATVRLQLHRGFTFDDAAGTVDYYAALGISHFYLSPVFAARDASTHGYDVVDPTRINQELGGEDGLLRLAGRLRAAGMGLVIDIVPNHMGIASAANPYWQHILQWGPQSSFAHWFDIDWQPPQPHLKGKLLLPVLGDAYEVVLQSGELAPQHDPASGRLFLACYDNRLPLTPGSCAGLLGGQVLLAPAAEAFAAAQSDADLKAAQQQLATLVATQDGRRALDQALSRYRPDAPEGVMALHALLAQQHYRLSWWRNAAEEINWRRFFEVADLAGVRVELDDVFEATHALVFQLYERGLIDGVRVDHVDGLADPAAYCQKLRDRLLVLQDRRPQALAQEPAWIVVEKILSPGESLPSDWKVDGTTGYDFMDQVGAVLHDADGEQALQALWQELTGDALQLDAHVQAARQQLLAAHFAGETEALAWALQAYAQSLPPAGRDITLPALRRVVSALLTCFRRYRCYATVEGCSAEDREVLGDASARARSLLQPPDHALLEEITAWLGAADAPDASAASRGLRARAVTRFQQLTPPLAAKSVEDTAFYRYGPLLSRNEVGSYPSLPAEGLEAFHAANKRRAEFFPHSLLATATHDHKRGEDVRARLAVLSEMPRQWASLLHGWMAANAPLRTTLVLPGGGLRSAPSPADELMLYQTLAGAWPPGLSPADSQGVAAFVERVAAWQEKALREAKLNSSWMAPQPAYEEACRAFLQGLFRVEQRPFAEGLARLVQEITPASTANTLTQTLLRLTCPGVPDLYQGTDLADFSLVDPDNRRPVDLPARRASLAEVWPVRGAGWDTNLQISGKQALTRAALHLRQQHPAVFCGGDYIPLEVTGPAGRHVIAFARSDGAVSAITVALRHPGRLFASGLANSAEWQDARIALPRGAAALWRDVLSENSVRADDSALPLAAALQRATVALLIAAQ